jgi:Secretion system C-terminal sorting domain
MKRSILFAAIAFISIGTFAQSWCPPGATWTYDSEMYTAGFLRMSYVRDTVIEGYDAQVIDKYTATQYPQPPPDPLFSGPPYTSYEPIAIITRHDSDAVFVRLGNDWDTLYWFGAAPGDHWFPPGISTSDCDQLVVVDTGTDVLSGVPLRWLRFSTSFYKVYERLGWTWSMAVFCPNWIIDGPMPMRCYHDEQIDVNFTQAPCEALVGVNELAKDEVSHLFPNPGTDQFTLELSAGPHLITLFDALGRAVLQHRTTQERATIGTAQLPSGIYTVRVDADPRPMHWVKE